MKSLIALLALGLVSQAHAQSAPTSAPVIAAYPAVHSTAIEGDHTLCSGPCKLFSVSITTGATAGNLLLIDATSDPADGTLTTTPTFCYPVSASYGQQVQWTNPVQFAKGLVAVFSTGANCVTKTESATAYFTAQVQ